MLRPPRRFVAHWRSVRMALTGLYAAFFVVLGAGLLAATGALTVHSTAVTAVPRAGSGPQDELLGQQAHAIAIHQHAVDLKKLFISSGIALVAMSGAAVCLGWIMAGRVLRPIAAISAATRQISATNLHERLAMHGPQDEVTDLADTIDGLLGRLETAFAAQRRFVANAAHELSTPLTLERALLEVALADPGASVASLRATCEEVLASNQDQSRLIEALLALATSERGIDTWDPVDLAATARHALDLRQKDVQRRGIRVGGSIGPASAMGNGDLLERLVANLVDNALRYNVPGGWIEVDTAEASGWAVLSVRNSGPIVPADQVGRLFLPFERLGQQRSSGLAGHGLGLSIVQAIAKAHSAQLAAQARADGGLDVQVRFPTRTASHRPRGTEP